MTDIGRSSQTNPVEPESAVSTSCSSTGSGGIVKTETATAEASVASVSRKQEAAAMTTEKPMKRVSKRGRKPSRIDTKAKLERSRQSARECRARKKLRYQYVEELVASREKSIQVLRDELEIYKLYCKQLDRGEMPPEIELLVQEHRSKSGNQPAPSAGRL